MITLKFWSFHGKKSFHPMERNTINIKKNKLCIFQDNKKFISKSVCNNEQTTQIKPPTFWRGGPTHILFYNFSRVATVFSYHNSPMCDY